MMDLNEDLTSMSTIVTEINDLELHAVMNASDLFKQTISPDFHSHPYFEIITAYRGSIYVQSLDHKRVDVCPGTICIIPPGQMHFSNSEVETFELIAMRFFYQRVKSEASKIYELFNAGLKDLDNITFIPNAQRLSGYMADIRREFGEKRLITDTMVKALLHCMFIELLRILCSTPQPSEGASVVRNDSKITRYSYIDRWFYNNHYKHVTEFDLAAEMNLSQRQLSRVMRDIFGMTFRERLVYERLNHAMHMLRRSDLPIEKIAEEVGYTNLSGFYKAFRARFGMTIGEYRKLYGNNDKTQNYPTGT